MLEQVVEVLRGNGASTEAALEIFRQQYPTALRNTEMAILVRSNNKAQRLRVFFFFFFFFFLSQSRKKRVPRAHNCHLHVPPVPGTRYVCTVLTYKYATCQQHSALDMAAR